MSTSQLCEPLSEPRQLLALLFLVAHRLEHRGELLREATEEARGCHLCARAQNHLPKVLCFRFLFHCAMTPLWQGSAAL